MDRKASEWFGQKKSNKRMCWFRTSQRERSTAMAGAGAGEEGAAGLGEEESCGSEVVSAPDMICAVGEGATAIVKGEFSMGCGPE